MKLGRFDILETLFDSESTKVLRVRDEHGRRSILKIINQEDEQGWYRLRHEQEIGKRLSGSQTLKNYGLVKVAGKHALMLEDFGAISLAAMMGEKPVSLNRFFIIMVQLAKALNNIHQYGIVHLDLTPANVLIEPESLELKISDFGLAEYRDRIPEIPQLFVGTYGYMSPEQFGRLNRLVDNRSDLYALGVIAYELLTGTRPFRGDDLLEVFHAHMTAHPGDIMAKNPVVPQQLQSVILRLLAKDPDRRYHSAQEILTDLERCQKYWEELGTIPEFLLSRPMNMTVPQSLFGRGDILNELIELAEHTGHNAERTVLITGTEGVGKSYLVHETSSRLSFGPFSVIDVHLDPEDKNKPYSSLLMMVEEYVEYLLLLPEAKRDQIAAAIAKRLGPNLDLILEGVPSLLDLYPYKHMDFHEKRTDYAVRFKYAMGDLLYVLITMDSGTIVAIVDGLEWMDENSIAILSDLCSATLGSRILLVGVAEGTEPEWFQYDRRYELGPIETHEALQFIQLLGPMEADDQTWLASHILHRSVGRHGYFVDLIKKAIDNGVFNYVQEANQFSVDRNRMEALEDPEVKEEMAAEQITGLSDEHIELLETAAVIGKTFDLEILEAVLSGYTGNTREDLLSFMRDGLILADQSARMYLADESYDGKLILRFANNAIRKGLIARIASERKEQIHFMTALLMTEGRDDKQFVSQDWVDHFNASLKLLPLDMYAHVLHMNHQVASRLMEWNRWKEALTYFQVGHQLIEQLDEASPCIHFLFCLERAECLFINGLLSQAEEAFDMLLGQAEEPMKKAQIHKSKMVLYIHDGLMEKAYIEAVAAFGVLGTQLNDKPSLLDVIRRALKIHRKTGFGRMDWIKDLPEMTDDQALLKMEIMMRLVSVSYLLGKWQFVDLIMAKVQLSLEMGKAPSTGFALGTYGLLSIGVFGNMERGYDLGLAALEMADEIGTDEVIGKTYFTMGFFLSNWIHHPRDAQQYLKTAQTHAMFAGDHVFYAYSVAAEILGYIHGDQPLPLIKERIMEEHSKLHDMEVTDIVLLFDALHHFVDMAAGIQWEEKDRQALDQALASSSMPSIPGIHLILRIRLAYLNGEYELVKSLVKEVKGVLAELIGLIIAEDVAYFEALSRLQQDGAAAIIHPAVRRTFKRLKKFSGLNEGLFAHRYELLRGEWLRTTGQYGRATKCYSRAIELAEQAGLIMEQAIVCETYGKALLERGNGRFAETMLKEAFILYKQYGLQDKCGRMDEAYPQFYFPTGANGTSGTETRSSSKDRTAEYSILKAAQVITSEVNPDELLRQFIDIIIQFSGASTVLLVIDESRGRVAAAYRTGQGIQIKEEIQAQHQYPDMIFRSLRRSRETFDTKQIQSHPYLVSDPYFSGRVPTGMLALPILQNQQFFGMLYLESDLEAVRYDQYVKDALGALCAQFVLSYNNATLYEKLSTSENALQEHRVRLEQLISERTAELFTAHKDIRTLLDNVSQGFMTLDHHLRIEPVISRRCRMIFGRHVGGDHWERLMAEFMEAGDLSMSIQSMEKVFMEPDEARRDAYLQLLPTYLVIEGHAVECSYRFIQGQDRNRLLVILTDVSDELAMKRKQETNQKMIELLTNFLTNREEITLAIHQFRGLLKAWGHEEAPTLLRDIHKYKGIFSQFGFLGTAKRIHEVESEVLVSGLKAGQKEGLDKALQEDILTVSQYTGLELSNWIERVDVSRKELRDFKANLNQRTDVPDLVEAFAMLEYKPLKELTTNLVQSVERLASKREKRVKVELTIPKTIYLSPGNMQVLYGSLDHLLKNALEHGIELPEEREKKGKSSEGLISLSVVSQDNHVHLTLMDDGAGVDRNLLQEIAREKEVNLTDEELLQLVFVPDVSTKEMVELESGRGYGLAFIKHEIEQLGGHIALSSTPDQETVFHLEIPIRNGVKIKGVDKTQETLM